LTWVDVFVRSRLRPHAIRVAALVWCASYFQPADWYPVPANWSRAPAEADAAGGVVVASLLWGLPVMFMVGAASTEFESGAPKARLLRAGWSALVVTGLALLAATATPPGGAPVASMRNAVFAAGLALVFAALVGPNHAWMPVVAAASVCLFLGVDREQVAFDWAFPLADSGSAPAMATSLLVALVGAAAYTIRDARASGV